MDFGVSRQTVPKMRLLELLSNLSHSKVIDKEGSRMKLFKNIVKIHYTNSYIFPGMGNQYVNYRSIPSLQCLVTCSVLIFLCFSSDWLHDSELFRSASDL